MFHYCVSLSLSVIVCSFCDDFRPDVEPHQRSSLRPQKSPEWTSGMNHIIFSSISIRYIHSFIQSSNFVSVFFHIILPLLFCHSTVHLLLASFCPSSFNCPLPFFSLVLGYCPPTFFLAIYLFSQMVCVFRRNSILRVIIYFFYHVVREVVLDQHRKICKGCLPHVRCTRLYQSHCWDGIYVTGQLGAAILC